MSEEFLAAKARWHEAQRRLDSVRHGKDPQAVANARREATEAATDAVALMGDAKAIPYRFAMKFKEGA